MKKYLTYAEDILLYIVIPVIGIFCIGILGGYGIGRATAPKPIVQYVDQPTPDREYLQRFKVAGEDRYQYILTKEWVTDIEFVTEEWRR